MPREFYDAGVYAIVSRKTGDTYVGASCFLKSRLTTHVNAIINGRRAAMLGPLRKFKGHDEQDIEIRILERVEVECDPTANRHFHRDSLAKPGWRKLMERERYWIRKLRASCNRNKRLPNVGIDIPILEPEAVPA